MTLDDDDERLTMHNKVQMICRQCNAEIPYEVDKEGCPSCGFITIECKKCKYVLYFGE